MAQIYRIDEHGKGEALERIYCRDEDKELQSALENNHDLLPGDQISSDDPCQWLLIRREMPVPDPSSGLNRWNIDFLFADQKAIPTFVECKRFNDTDSRRKVVGQMMEYAANGHRYWSASELQSFANRSATTEGSTVSEALKGIGWGNADEPETFFETMEDNLREGQVRLVFFLEKASSELKSIVEFLNNQMERSEVLLVEARQYRVADQRIISPSLFGYSEEARFIKRKVNIESRSNQVWNTERFIEQASHVLDKSGLNTVEGLLNSCKDLGAEITWGRGQQGTYSVKWTQLSNQNLFYVRSDGRLEFPFGALNKTEEDQILRERLKSLVKETMNLPVPADYEKRYPGFKLEQWQPSVNALKTGVQGFLEESR